MIEGEELKRALDIFAYEILNKMDADRPVQEPTTHPDANWASELPHPCARMLTYSRLNGSERRPMDIEGRYRVEEGVKMELDVRHEIERQGFEVVMNQKSVTWPEYKIRGRIDGEVYLRQDKLRQLVPIEIVTVQPWYWESCASIDKILRHKKFWIRRKPRQLNTYLFCESLPGGLLIVRTFGKRPRILPMLINYEIGEEDIKRAEEVNLHVEAGEYPDRIPYDEEVCGMCGFNHICQPVTFAQLDDVPLEFIADLNEYCDMQPYADRQNELAKKLLGDNKKPGFFRGKNAIVGDITISSNTYETTRVKNLPDDIKAKYSKTDTVTKTTIKRREAENGE